MINELGDYFEYNILDSEFSVTSISKNFNSLKKRSLRCIQNWNEEQNSQWIIRDYLAVKMILSSSVLLS